MKHYPLIIFDWDGTLVDSIHRIVTSLQYASRLICDARISTQQARSAETLLPFSPLFCLSGVCELPKYLLQAKMA